MPELPTVYGNLYTDPVIAPPQAADRAKQIDWYRFLARPRLPSPTAESLAPLKDASILITGAGGSIGSELSLRLAALQPKRLLLLDASEQALHGLQSALNQAPLPTQPKLILANIANQAHLEEIFAAHRPELVFHAAAYKHVPLLEEHPLEAIANNALGTLTLAQCAQQFGAARIVLLSTDKAVAPISILGATKRIAEQITLAHNGIVVRLGNVLGTEGSVSETFQHQIASGGPVTLTTPGAERYFLTCEEAVDLLLASAVSANDQSLLVPNLARQHRIAALAEFLLAELSPTHAIPVVHTGNRVGDKAREALWSSDEEAQISTIDGCVRITYKLHDNALPSHDLDRLQRAVQERDLAIAMDVISRLIPDYMPSERVMSLLQQAAIGAMQR